MKPFFTFLRFPNLVIIALTMNLLRYRSLPDFIAGLYPFLALVLGTVFIAAAGNIVNDIYDVAIDKINKPKAVFIDEYISKKNAWLLYLFFNSMALCLAIALLDKLLVFVFLMAIVLLFFYSKTWKKQALIGNLVVALLCAWVVMEFWYLEQEKLSSYWQTILLLYTMFAFFSTLARELIKDVQDLEGDRALGAQTLAIRIGVEASKNVILLVFFALAAVLVFELLMLYDYSNRTAVFYLFIFLIMPLLGLMYRVKLATRKENFESLSKLVKGYMLLGLGLLLLV